MDPFKQLREEFAATHKEATDLVALAATENRELKPEEKTANDKRFARLETIKGVMDEHLKFAKLAIAGDAGATGTVTTPAEPAGRAELEAAAARTLFAAKPGEPADAGFRRHRNAINEFIRTGSGPALQFTLTTGSGSGVLLPTTVGTPVVLKAIQNPVRAALLARGLQVIRTDDMSTMSVPVFDDTGNSADVIAQTSTSENNKDPSVTGLSLGADLYDSGTVWSSNTLLGSLNFDLLGYLQPMLDARIDAAETAAWTTLLAAATVGKTTATTTGVTYAELLDWQHSIPVVARYDGVFFLSDGLFRTIRGLVDTTGQPIYQESLRDEAPNRLLGWPVFVLPGLATPAAGAVSGLAASASALVVRDVNNRRIARYANIPTHADAFGIREFSNGGFAFVAGRVRALKHAAS